MTGKTTEVKVLTEGDLLKAIQDLDSKAKPPEKVESPKVETASLKKSTIEGIRENGGEGLRKVLDVSETLSAFAKAVGTHVDSMMEPMFKSIQSGAERDLAIVQVLKDLKKSIDENTEAVKEFGKLPTSPKTPVTRKDEVLKKSVSETGGEVDPTAARRLVVAGLEKLTKSLPPGSLQAQEYINAAVQFESTGSISDTMLAKAQAAAKAA